MNSFYLHHWLYNYDKPVVLSFDSYLSADLISFLIQEF